MIGRLSPTGPASTAQAAARVRRRPPGRRVSGMTKVRQALGAWGERLAAAHLVGAGMVVLDRNWRGAGGEIDIIARDGDAVVFCEVKTRRGTAYGTPAEAIGWAKVRKLRHL